MVHQKTYSTIEAMEPETDLQDVAIKKEIEDKPEFDFIDVNGINEQEVQAKYEEENYQEMTIEKHEVLDDISYEKCNTIYPSEDFVEPYPIVKKFKLDNQDEEDMTNNDKLFKCSKCDYSCAFKSNVKKHVSAVHYKEKPFKCSECDYSCAAKTIMTKHVSAVHNKEKPFKCNECDFSCSYKATMTRHVRAIHDKVKPFKCIECDYACTFKSSMTVHVRAVHDKEKPFKCSECVYSSAMKGTLLKHIMGMHEKYNHLSYG